MHTPYDQRRENYGIYHSLMETMVTNDFHVLIESCRTIDIHTATLILREIIVTYLKALSMTNVTVG